jgi:hypothetical protein
VFQVWNRENVGTRRYGQQDRTPGRTVADISAVGDLGGRTAKTVEF